MSKAMANAIDNWYATIEKWSTYILGGGECPRCGNAQDKDPQNRIVHMRRCAQPEVVKHFDDRHSSRIPSAEGRKDDAGKLRWSLLPLRAMKSVVEVLEYGARKYSEGGWKSVSRQRYVEAAFRHMVAIADGEKLDAESGLPHAAHAVCCLLFIIHFDGEKP